MARDRFGRRPDWLAPALLALAVPVALTTLVWPAAPVALAVVAVLTTAACVVPRHLLPATSLVALVAIPLEDVPLPGVANTLSPSTALLAVWLCRLAGDLKGRPPGRSTAVPVLLVVPLLCLLVLSAATGHSVATSGGWGLAFTVNVAGAALGLAYEDRRAAEAVRTAWVWSAAALGALAVLEAFVLQANLPILGLHLVLGGEPAWEQVWGVYRATTTMGHPLDGAAFFAVAVPLALVEALRRPAVSTALLAALPAVGLVTTVSRGAFAATVAAAAVVLVLEGRRSRQALRRVAAVAVVLLVVVGLGAALQLQRNQDSEAASSTDYRVGVLASGVEQVLDAPLLGVGAGVSALHKEDTTGGSTDSLSYENGWLEAAVGAGLPATGLLLLLVLVAVRRAARSGDTGVLMALLVLAPVMSTYNFLEGDRPGLVRLGLLVGVGLAAGARSPLQEGRPTCAA